MTTQLTVNQNVQVDLSVITSDDARRVLVQYETLEGDGDPLLMVISHALRNPTMVGRDEFLTDHAGLVAAYVAFFYVPGGEQLLLRKATDSHLEPPPNN